MSAKSHAFGCQFAGGSINLRPSMLLYLALNLFQPVAGPVGDWPGTACQIVQASGSAPVRLTSDEEIRVAALRQSLFKTPKPALLSYDLPTLPSEPPRPVAIARAPESTLRELGAQPAGFTPYDRYLGSVR